MEITMNNTHPFRIGAYDCTLVLDGSFAYPHPGPLFFANAPESRRDEAIRAHNINPATWEEYVSPYPTLLVNTGEQLVLIDTGAGDFGPNTGNLVPNLRSMGVAPEEIDTVFLTHGHLDHIGGNLDSAGNPAFVNARYLMGKAEWEFWRSGPDLSFLQVNEHLIQAILSSAEKNLPPIENHLDLVEDGDEIAPGIHVHAAPGHTPGHMALSIRSEGEQFFYLVDTLIHPIHVEQPDWVSAADMLPEETVVTRRKLLGRAASEQALVHVFHFPFPGLGHVVLHDGGWRWRPYSQS
jgi:glyoxylase-like metal-dependent hydrolase (beta-lactamase superfamily II)